jgi:hypothetical protein
MNNFTESLCEIMPIIEKASPLVGLFLKDSKVSVVIGLLAALVNCNPNNPDELVKKLKDDPDLYAKLKNLENTHADWLGKL